MGGYLASEFLYIFHKNMEIPFYSLKTLKKQWPKAYRQLSAIESYRIKGLNSSLF
jgi:hypothetical protein